MFLKQNGSFSNLITQTSANVNTIVQAPLMFVRGGYVYPGRNLRDSGNSGGYWSSVSRSNNNTDHLYFNLYGIDPSLASSQYIGYSVRCVALGG